MKPCKQLETNDQAKYEIIRLFLHKEHYSLIANSSVFWMNYQSNYEEHQPEADDWQTANGKGMKNKRQKQTKDIHCTSNFPPLTKNQNAKPNITNTTIPTTTPSSNFKINPTFTFPPPPKIIKTSTIPIVANPKATIEKPKPTAPTTDKEQTKKIKIKISIVFQTSLL